MRESLILEKITKARYIPPSLKAKIYPYFHTFRERTYKKLIKQSTSPGVGQDYFLPYTLRYNFNTIIDIGTGPFTHIVDFFIKNGKEVYSIDIEKRNSYEHQNYHFITGNFLNYTFTRKFDAVWASHVLEHVQDTGLFLNKVYELLNDDGIFFCIVPPHKTQIVGGHVTIGWNIGILMYNLILCGFNVNQGRFKKHGYNIAAFVTKRKGKILPEDLIFDAGDIEKLADYWPNKDHFKQNFEGVC